jgi:hypothetical protein
VWLLGAAFAFPPGAEPSAPAELTSSNLPLLVIDTHGRAVPDEPKITADMGVIFNGEGVRNRLSDPFNHYDGPIGIEIRGNVTQSFPKKSYYVETRDAEGRNRSLPLLGLPPENDWILLAAYIDKTLMRDALACRMSRLTGRWAPRTSFCELVLNGEYLGAYVLIERIKPDRNRLDIARMDSADVDGDAVTGGYVYQVSQEEPAFGERRGFVYPKAGDIRPEQAAYLREFDDGFRRAMSRADFDDPLSGYPAWIDADSFIDEILVQEACKNSDAYGWSSYFHKERLGPLRAGPVWDFDQSLSNSTFNDGPNWGEWIVEKSESDPYLRTVYPRFWLRLFREPAFRKRLARRWSALREGPFRTDSLMQFVNRTAALLDEAQARNFQKWPVLGAELWRSTPGWRERNTYRKEVDYLKTFLLRRLGWMDDRLRADGASAGPGRGGSAPGGFALRQNHPNPFNPASVIRFSIPEPGRVRLTVFDARGGAVRTLVDGERPAGEHAAVFDASGLPAGVYLFRLEAERRFSETKKMVLAR